MCKHRLIWEAVRKSGADCPDRIRTLVDDGFQFCLMAGHPVQTQTTGPSNALAHLILAHGAGAPMSSPFLETFATMLAARSVRVTRFNFPYMAAFQDDGKRRPPPRVEGLGDVYRAFVGTLSETKGSGTPLFIGGKSMGGRIATLIADDVARALKISGVVCLGYPFHPKGKPVKLRTAHLETLRTPTLIVQGERDGLGTKQEVARYGLSDTIQLAWAKDGDHDLKPRKQSGVTLTDNLTFAADETARWIAAQTKSEKDV